MSGRFRTSTLVAAVAVAAVVGFSGGAISGIVEGLLAGPVTSQQPAAAPDPAAAGSPSPVPAPSASPTTGPSTSPAAGLTATAAPTDLAAGERVDITGALSPPQEGATVGVQRLEGEQWAAFDASTTVRADGTYALWVASSRPGDQQFRTVVLGPAGELLAASEPVTVRYH